MGLTFMVMPLSCGFEFYACKAKLAIEITDKNDAMLKRYPGREV